MKKILILILMLFLSHTTFSQAQLKIVNNSQRNLQIKIMTLNEGKSNLYKQLTINAQESKTVFFQESGLYFTKTKAILKGKTPVFEKGNPFKVYNGSDGYSVLTLTFSLIETKTSQMLSGKQISQKEFEEN
jgi:hypothetical protein